MNSTHVLYLGIDIASVIVPFLFSFHPTIQFNKNFISFLWSNIITAFIFIAWDIYFTSKGIWGFNKNDIVGLYIFNLPIEEVLFFICIPFACLFTFYCFDQFFVFKKNSRTEPYITFIFIITSMATAFIFNKKEYPFYVFFSLSILLFFLKYIIKITWLMKVYKVYIVLMIPFLIVNGLLTGTGLQAPIVWYNKYDIIGTRIYTIPIEDVFYGFELILMQIVTYHYFALYFKRKN